MPVKIVPITKKQLLECFKPYSAALSDWAVEHDVMLSRTHGALKQVIHFEALPSGVYRPTHAVEILAGVPDGCSMLHKHLDVKHREVLPRDHAVKWPSVLKAMEEQFLPAIRQPLDVAETLRLAEEQAQRDRIDNINYSTGLAVLNAYLGNTARGLYWCGRVEEAAAHLGRALADWETRKRRNAFELQQAIKACKHGEFLS